MSSSPSATLGKYQIIREIARSNDIVYEAYDPLMHRRVALKELSMPSGVQSQQRDDRVRRFQREVKAAGSLAHPNIVTIYEVGEENGRHYMAMEYLDGHTLRNEIDTKGFLDQTRAIEIAIDVLCALDFAHNHGVIHRDIKPENIQILENGTVKLTDFGIARLTFEPNLTMDGQVFGTPSYMSPEQVVGKEIDLRSDLWGVGVVLFEMLAGSKPFIGDSVVSISYSIMHTEPSQPVQVSWGAWQVLQTILQKTPALRYSTAKDFVAALQTLLQPGPVMPNPTAPAPSIVPPPVPYGVTGAYPGQVPYPAQTQYPQPYPAQQTYPGQTVYPGQYPTYGQPVPVPIYYPPPPRQPLLQPETKLFLKRLFITLLLVGTLFVLVFVAISSVSKAIDRNNRYGDDAKVQLEIDRKTANAGVDERIRSRETAIPSLKSSEAKAEEGRKLADDYTQKSAELEKKNLLYEAEEWLQKATEADPQNPVRQMALSEFYARRAQVASRQDEKIEAELASAYALGKASGVTQNDAESRRLAERAAEQLVQISAQIELTDPARARQALTDARRIAPPDSEIRAAIEQMLQLRR